MNYFWQIHIWLLFIFEMLKIDYVCVLAGKTDYQKCFYLLCAVNQSTYCISGNAIAIN